MIPRRTFPPRAIPRDAVVNDRYEVRSSIGKHGVLEMILAFDRATKQDVVLEIVQFETAFSPDDGRANSEWAHDAEAWARDAEAWVSLAQRVRHPNVCRVHGVERGPWGPFVVTEYVAGKSLHHVIRDRRALGGMTANELRSIATGLFGGLAALHAAGVIHGDIKPGKMRIAADRAVIHSFWFAQRADVETRRSPDGGTPNYMSPERLRGGGASFEDDVYAMALTLWEAFTCRVPEPGYDPFAEPIRLQLMCKNHDAQVTTSELRQLFRALHPDPSMRPRANQMHFGAEACGELPASDDEDRLFAERAGQK